MENFHYFIFFTNFGTLLDKMAKLTFLIVAFTCFAQKGYSQCAIHATILTEWSCNGNQGRILPIVLSGGVPPYQYTLDYGTSQSSYIFSNVPSGYHHIKIQDAVCSVEYDLSLTPNSNLSATVNLSEIACGKITIGPYAGYPPFLSSINGGAFQSSTTFSNLSAGTYNIVVKDATDCITTVPPIVITTNPLTVTSTKTNTLCPGSNSGSILLTAADGTTPYSYSINGGVSFQASNSFTGLSAGIYQFIVKDFNNCKYIRTDTIINGLSGVSANAMIQNAACNGSSTGSITITPTVGLPPFTYTFGSSTQSSNIFTGLLAGTYPIVITDANGCNFTITPTVGNNPGLTATLNTVATACSGSATGSITVNSVTGINPYTYSLNNLPLQNSNTFTGLSAGGYTVNVTDGNGCSVSLPAVVDNGIGITATAITQNASCTLAANGNITIAPNLGLIPYSYSLDGGIFQGSNFFNNILPGNHTIIVKDANNCSYSFTSIVSSDPGITAAFSSQNSACAASATGSITITATLGIAPYSYSLNGGPFQSSNIYTGLSAGNYTIIVKDAVGCSFSGSYTVNSNPGVTATSSSVNTACGTATTGSITITASGGIAPYSYSLDGGVFQPSNVFTGLATGPHAIVVKDAANCIFTLTATVGNNPEITATLITVATACSGSATGSITVNPVTGINPYTYSLNNLPLQNSNTFTGLSAGGYTVNVTDGNGCSVSLPAVVDNGVGITATATTQNATCPSAANGSITIAPNLGLMPYSYSLDGGIFQSSNFFNNILPGNHTITVKDANNCSYSFNSIVSSDPGINAAFSSQNSACAASATGSITITATLGIAPYSYSLNGGPFQSSNIYTGLSAGNYTIIVKDAVGCSFSGSYTVHSNPGVTATSSSVNTACGTATTGSITITASGGIAPYTYSLDGGIFQPSNVFTGLASGPHAIVVKDAVNCIFTKTESVASDPGVNATSIVVNAGCPGSASGSITVNAFAGVVPYEYSLNGAAFQSSNVFSGLMANSYSLKVKDAAGCLFNFNAIVNNDPLLTVTLNIAEPSCYGAATGNITINPLLGKAPYEFALDNNVYQPGNTFINLGGGTYMIHIKDANGCIKDTFALLNQPAPLSAITDTLASTCIANDGTITVTATGGTPSYLYSGNNGNSYQASNILKVSPGIYNVVVKDNQGCLFNTIAIVTLKDDMILDIGDDTTSCFGIPVTIIPRTNGTTNIFNWTPAGGNLDISTGAYTVSPSDTTHYVLNASYGLCQRSDNMTINVLRKPIVYAGNDTLICDKTSAFLHGIASNLSGNVTYLWSPSNGVTSEDTDTTTVKPTTLGPNTYMLQVSDNYGCNFKVTDSMVVTMNQIPVAFAGNDTIAAMNLPHQLLGKGGLSCAWSSGSLLNNPYTKTPVAILSRDTKFILTVYDNAGCSGTDTVLVKVYQGPTYYIPNAFTPNNDGLNDIFKAIPPGITKTDYFRIYNRWGQLIFETHQYLKGWDGTFVGKPQPNGSYVWHIKGIDKFGKVVEMKGTVVLIR